MWNAGRRHINNYASDKFNTILRAEQSRFNHLQIVGRAESMQRKKVWKTSRCLWDGGHDRIISDVH